MSKNPETITTRIHDKADAELKQKIEAAVATFKTTLRDAGVSTYEMRPKIHRNFLRSTTSAELPFNAMPELIAMEFEQLAHNFLEAAFAVSFIGNRTRAVDAYMKRIEDLASKCEELQSQIDEVRQ